MSQTRQQLAKIIRKKDHVNIGFYGFGSITYRAMGEIANIKQSELDVPIKKIYIMSREGEAKVWHGKRVIQQYQEGLAAAGSDIEIEHMNMNELGRIAHELDLIEFTASAAPPREGRRPEMIKYNKPLIEKFAERLNQGGIFQGLINVSSNLPEALAAYLSNLVSVDDVRQISAHMPLDSNRYKYLVYETLKGNLDEIVGRSIPKGQRWPLSVAVLGHHDLPWPIVNGTCIELGYGHDNTPIYKPVGDSLLDWTTQENLAEKLELFGFNQFMAQIDEEKVMQDLLQSKQYIGDYKKILDEFPTESPTGKAIKDQIVSWINRGTSHASVPYEIEGKTFFAYMPVTYKCGWAEPDEDRLKNATVKDWAKVTEFFYSHPKKALQKHLTDTGIGDMKSVPTSDMYYMFNRDIPRDQAIMKPDGMDYSQKKPPIFYRQGTDHHGLLGSEISIGHADMVTVVKKGAVQNITINKK